MGLFKKKDPIVEVEKALDHEVHEMEHDIQADVDAVMKKYDRESNTRIWEGAPKIALQVLMSAFSIYCILMTLFSKALPERRLSLFLGFIMATFMNLPNVLPIAIAAVCLAYINFVHEKKGDDAIALATSSHSDTDGSDDDDDI